ncbi:MAG: hypothetical protein ACLFP1_04345 [Candidatus Goldiibacteriota bacterium]
MAVESHIELEVEVKNNLTPVTNTAVELYNYCSVSKDDTTVAGKLCDGDNDVLPVLNEESLVRVIVTDGQGKARFRFNANDKTSYNYFFAECGSEKSNIEVVHTYSKYNYSGNELVDNNQYTETPMTAEQLNTWFGQQGYQALKDLTYPIGRNQIDDPTIADMIIQAIAAEIPEQNLNPGIIVTHMQKEHGLVTATRDYVISRIDNNAFGAINTPAKFEDQLRAAVWTCKNWYQDYSYDAGKTFKSFELNDDAGEKGYYVKKSYDDGCSGGISRRRIPVKNAAVYALFKYTPHVNFREFDGYSGPYDSDGCASCLPDCAGNKIFYSIWNEGTMKWKNDF